MIWISKNRLSIIIVALILFIFLSVTNFYSIAPYVGNFLNLQSTAKYNFSRRVFISKRTYDEISSGNFNSEEEEVSSRNLEIEKTSELNLENDKTTRPKFDKITSPKFDKITSPNLGDKIISPRLESDKVTSPKLVMKNKIEPKFQFGLSNPIQSAPNLEYKKTSKFKKIKSKLINSTNTDEPTCGYLIGENGVGRLGNRMFIYASFYGIAKLQGLEAKKSIFIRSDENPYFLEGFFENLTIPRRSLSKSWYENKTLPHIGERLDCGYDDNGINDLKCDGKHSIVGGYRQSFRYFIHVRDEIRREFRFNDKVKTQCVTSFSDSLSKRGLIRNQCATVGVHLRRGDFTNPGKMAYGHMPAKISYLQKAIRFFENLLLGRNELENRIRDESDRVKNRLFNDSDFSQNRLLNDAESFKKFILTQAAFYKNRSHDRSDFSRYRSNQSESVNRSDLPKNGSSTRDCLAFLILGDDYQWNLNASNQAVISFPDKTNLIVVEPKEAAIDFCLLTLCQHMAMSTGSFGWWAAFLGNGLVTYQKEFAGVGSPLEATTNANDYFLPYWIPL